MPSLSVATRSSSSTSTCGSGAVREVELAERLLELGAHVVERRARLGGDRRPDELEREPDRARLERRQARGRAEGLAVELLVDADRVALELRVDRVAAAAEVDEVEQREVLLELLGRDVEALDQLARLRRSRASPRRRRRAGRRAAPGGRRSAPARPARPDGRARARRRSRRRRRASSGGDPAWRSRISSRLRATSSRSARGSSGAARPSWRRIQPASCRAFENVGDEDAVRDRAVLAVQPLDPPRRVRRDADRAASRRRAAGSASPAAAGARRRRSPGGMRKSRSRRVAKRMSPRMRETFHVFSVFAAVVEIGGDDVPAARARAAARTG